MFARSLPIVILLLSAPTCRVLAEEPTAREVVFHGYVKAVELRLGKTRAVLCPQVGGRVLEFSVEGNDAMYLDEADKTWRPGKPAPSSAGRFDYGPEMTTIRHPQAWAGEWTAEITPSNSVKLTSPPEAAGIRLVREFRLVPHDRFVGLSCKQTMTNVSKETREVCHWGRSFSPAGGICVIPLGDRPSRFPGKYAMYEVGGVINVKVTDDQIREREGYLEILAPPRKPKLGFDTYAGWFAYAMPNDTLFVKRFPTYPDRVYNEAAGLTLSVWYPPGPLIELEPIGPRERLRPGESVSFTEDWWLLPYSFPKNGQRIDLKALAEQVARQTVVVDSPRVVRENIEWLDVWIPGNSVKDHPRVLLVGDSITRAYYKTVDGELKGKAVVCRLATSKSLGDPGLLDEVALVLGQARFDVVHFNNGMHGWGYTEDEYAKALPDLVATIRKGAPGARLVWASTTPVRVAGKIDQLDPKTSRVMARNKAARAVMAREKIATNDLFALVADQAAWFSNDGVHLNAKGSTAMGEQVAAEILKVIRGK